MSHLLFANLPHEICAFKSNQPKLKKSKHGMTRSSSSNDEETLDRNESLVDEDAGCICST